MATLVKNFPLINVSTKNLVTALLFISAIVGLFFIPELLSLRGRIGVGSHKVESISPVKPEVLPQEQPAVSPLEDLLNKINSGYYSKQERHAEVAGQQARNGNQQFEVAPGKVLSWETLKADKGESSLRRAQSTARTL